MVRDVGWFLDLEFVNIYFAFHPSTQVMLCLQSIRCLRAACLCDFSLVDDTFSVDHWNISCWVLLPYRWVVMDCFQDLYPSFAVCVFFFYFSLFTVHLLTIVFTLILQVHLFKLLYSVYNQNRRVPVLQRNRSFWRGYGTFWWFSSMHNTPPRVPGCLP